MILLLILISKLIASLIRRSIIQRADKEQRGTEATKVGNLVHDIVFYILVIFSFFVWFQLVGLDVSLIIGWVSFGIWLAFKEVLGNMIAGIMILTTKQVKLGDIIEVAIDGGYFGRVEEITIRYTVLRTLDLRQVVLPNMSLISTPIKTYSSEELVKMRVLASIHYDADIATSIKVIVDAVNSLDFIKNKESTSAYVTEFWDYTIDITCLFYIDPNGWLLPEYAIGYANEVIRNSLIASGIEIPYPILTVTYENSEERNKVKIIEEETSRLIEKHVEKTTI